MISAQFTKRWLSDPAVSASCVYCNWIRHSWCYLGVSYFCCHWGSRCSLWWCQLTLFNQISRCAMEQNQPWFTHSWKYWWRSELCLPSIQIGVHSWQWNQYPPTHGDEISHVVEKKYQSRLCQNQHPLRWSILVFTLKLCYYGYWSKPAFITFKWWHIEYTIPSIATCSLSSWPRSWQIKIQKRSIISKTPQKLTTLIRNLESTLQHNGKRNHQ